MIKRLIKRLVGGVVAFTPKFRCAVLRGFPDYDDNCVAIYEGLATYKFRRIVWVVSDLTMTAPIPLRPGTVIVRRGSVLDYFYSIFSKYLFITHGHFIEDIPSNQVCTNLWHGIPYKVIGKLDGKEGRNDSWVVGTSVLTRGVFARVFGVDEGKVVVSGQPRTDRLFGDIDAVRSRLPFSMGEKTKLLLWLPTYRKTDMNGGRTDGKDAGNVFNCDGFPISHFDSFLREQDAICLVKPHPMSAKSVSVSTDNIIYVDDAWLNARGLTLYQLAGAIDCLVSDVSSIVIDFMLMDKPAVLLFEDISEYRASRGFVFAPLEEWLPARVNKNYAGFIDDLSAALDGDDRYREKRSQLRNAFFAYADNKSTQRLLNHVIGTMPPV